MADDKVNKKNEPCCNVPASEETSICRECGNKGKSVKDYRFFDYLVAYTLMVGKLNALS